jgi:hypothetical protein
VGSKASPIARITGAIGVGLLLWRVQLQIFINQTARSRQAGRLAGTIIGAAVILLAWSWEAFATVAIVAAAQRGSFQVNTVDLLSLAFFAYTAILIFSSFIFSLNALLLNPDLDLLLVAPRPVEGILGGRMVVQILRLLLLSLLFTGPALLVVAVATQNPLLPVAFAALFLLYPVFVVVLVSLLSLLLVRVIPAGRGREILTLLGVLLALGFNLANFLINPAFRGPGAGGHRPRIAPTLPDVPGAASVWLPSGWAGRSAAAVLAGDWLTAFAWGAVLLAVSVALFGIGAAISGRLYLAGWIQAVPPRRRRLRTAIYPRPGKLPLLSPLLAAIVIKDWRMRIRDLAQLVRFAMPVVFLLLIFGLRFPGVTSAASDLGQGPVAAMLGLLPAWILLMSLGLSLGLSAVSLEGRNIWVYAASPNTLLQFLQGKCWSTALPTAIIVGLVAIAAEIVIRPGWLWATSAILVAVVQAGTVSILMVGIGAVWARFDWTDARRMTSPLAVFIAMLLFGVITVAMIVVFGIALALASATGFPLFTTWLAAMAITVGGGIAVAALGLLIGNERLRVLELG